MKPVSVEFVLYILVVSLLYLAIPKARWQHALLLATSLIFYALNGVTFVYALLLVSCLSFIASRRITSLKNDSQIYTKGSLYKKDIKQNIREKCDKRARLIRSVTVVFIALFGIVSSAVSAISGETAFAPIGIGFFSLTAIAYILDVYAERFEAEKKLSRYLLFVSYFPHILRGPIARYDELSESLFEVHRFEWDRASDGLRRMLWGFFKKAIVADRLSLFVAPTLESPESFAGPRILAALLLYGIQIYADFSGYVDIMGGVSEILGIKLTGTMRQPYLAASVGEFWQRWNTSLRDWTRDYILGPVSVSSFAARMGAKLRGKSGSEFGSAYVSLFCVWTFMGIWHGFGLNQLIWAWLTLMLIIIGSKSDKSRLPRPLGCVCTYLILTLLRTISTQESPLRTAMLWKSIFTGFGGAKVTAVVTEAGAAMQPGTAAASVAFGIPAAITAAGIIGMAMVDIFCEKEQWQAIKEKCPLPVKNLVAVLLIYSIVLTGGLGLENAGGYMYANF